MEQVRATMSEHRVLERWQRIMGYRARRAGRVNSLVSGGGRKWLAAVADLADEHTCRCACTQTHSR